MRQSLKLHLLVFAIVLTVTLRASAGAPNLWHVTTIDPPHSTRTVALDINPAGEIVGRYISAIDNNEHGFLRNDLGEFTTIDYPAAVFTVAAGISPRGDIVGWYRLPTDQLDERHGFLLRDGQFSTIDPHGARSTNPLGINSRGDVVGRFCTVGTCMSDTGDVHGFLLTGGVFATVDFPSAIRTNAWKINSRGQIVGGYTGADNQNHFFVADRGNFTRVDLPPTVTTISIGNGGMNSRGDIASFYCNTAPCTINNAHGLLLSNDEFSSFDVPGAAATGIFGISPDGNMVGAYFDTGGSEHGFLVSTQ